MHTADCFFSLQFSTQYCFVLSQFPPGIIMHPRCRFSYVLFHKPKEKIKENMQISFVLHTRVLAYKWNKKPLHYRVVLVHLITQILALLTFFKTILLTQKFLKKVLIKVEDNQVWLTLCPLDINVLVH